MAVVDAGAARRGLIERVKNIIMTPKSEWDVIDVEPQTVKSLYMGYALPLAAIPAIVTVILVLLIASVFAAFAGWLGMFAAAAATPVLAVFSAVAGFIASLICLFVF